MKVKNINAATLRQLIKSQSEKLELIDVREPYEYNQLHIKGSKLMPMNSIMGRVSEIDFNKEVVFICRSGARSGMIANAVASQMGKEVHNLMYGIMECHGDGKAEFLAP